MSGVSVVATYVANAVWLATVVAAAGWLAAQCLKKLGPRAEHIGWVVALSVAIVAPTAPLLRRMLNLSGGQSLIGGHSPAVTVTATYATAGLRGLYQLPAFALWIIAALYCAAVLYRSGRFAWLLYRTTQMAENAQPLELTREQEEIWERTKRMFGLDRILLAGSAEVHAPILLGVRETTLILPEGFAARCTPADLETAFAHECAHASRRDFTKNLGYEAASLVLAFHPAVWAIKAQIAQTREMVCDSMVAERVLEARSYALSLLRLAKVVAASPRAARVHAIGIFDANILEKRIMMMNRAPRPCGRMMRFGLTAASLLMLAVTCSVAATRAFAVGPESASAANQTTSNGPVYKVGNGVSAPVVIHSVAAKYPKSYLNVKPPVDTTVVVRVVVDKSGMPQDVRVIKSYVPAFDQEAVKAVDQFRFKPGMREGVPVAVAVTVEVNFRWY